MCAIFGVWNAKKAAELCVIGLHGNQHRAIDYAGIVSSDGSNLYRECGPGLARQAFTKRMIDALHGQVALGHLRYPTVEDDETRDNIQPIVGNYGGVAIAIAHNGNLTNLDELREAIPGVKLATSMDTELVLRLLQKVCTGNIERDLATVCAQVKGSYALGILLPDRLIAVRDKSGNRPLSVGGSNGGYFVSSETCAFGNVGATPLFDVLPGTMIVIDKDGIRTAELANPEEKKCRFEAIYFSHPSSKVFGEGVTTFRLKLGEALERHCPAPGASIVTPIPDSAVFIAQGFARSGRSGAYFPVIIRNHYVGRTFIAATQAMRDEDVSQKFNFTVEKIAGEKIVIVDDSIVRGTTLPKIVAHLRRYGAREVHVRIGCPPITYSCRYGINTPNRDKLIASKKTPEEICEWVGADSLAYLPLDVLKILSPKPESFCYACMTGEYW
jgi:amidophosphoribosyltransferase